MKDINKIKKLQLFLSCLLFILIGISYFCENSIAKAFVAISSTGIAIFLFVLLKKYDILKEEMKNKCKVI